MTEATNQPTDSHVQPELKQVLGALVYAARKPITTAELLGVLEQVAQKGEDTAHSFGKIQESDIRAALEQLKAEYAERKLGLILAEVAGGFRFQTDPAGGPWVRQLLNLDKPARLSKPALETLAIIAYRQPATRAEIEALRGVNIDAMMRHLLELQLIRIVGRSELPGRPLTYGTTQLFLEHFGLGSVKNLPGVEQLSRRDADRIKKEADDRRQKPDAGRQPALHSLGEAGTTGDSPEKAEQQPDLPILGEAGTPDARPEKTEDGMKTEDKGQETEAANVPTSPRSGASGPLAADGEHPTEERTAEQEGPETTDDPQRQAEGVEAEETEEDEEDDEDDEDDEDEEDEDEEGKE